MAGDAGLVEIANRWLAHLEARQFSAATVRGYAFDVVCLVRFLDEVGVLWRDVAPSDVFDWLECQARPRLAAGQKVFRLGDGRGASPATMNRRVAATRGLFEFAVMCGDVEANPVPAPRRSAVCGLGIGVCSATAGPVSQRRRPDWCARIDRCPRASKPKTSRCSCRISTPIETGRSPWRCCSEGCGRARFAR